MVEIAERGMHGVIPIVSLLRGELDQKSSHEAETDKRGSRPYELFIRHGEPSPMIPFEKTTDSIFVNLAACDFILAS